MWFSLPDKVKQRRLLALSRGASSEIIRQKNRKSVSKSEQIPKVGLELNGRKAKTFHGSDLVYEKSCEISDSGKRKNQIRSSLVKKTSFLRLALFYFANF